MRRKLVPWLVRSPSGAALVALLVFGLTTAGLEPRARRRGRGGHGRRRRRTRRARCRCSTASARAAPRSRAGAARSWSSTSGRRGARRASPRRSLIEQAAARARARAARGTVVGIDYKDVGSQALALHPPPRPDLPEPARHRRLVRRAPTAPTALPETFVLDRHLRVVAIARGADHQRAQARRLDRAARSARETRRTRARARARLALAAARRSPAAAVRSARRCTPIEPQVMCVTCGIPLVEARVGRRPTTSALHRDA